ncbi:polyamine aminopropyltransferase [Planctomycetota bacterium]|nr:polyamine aminopropyltransferase [Planctomycetota bacterium]
MNEKSLTNRQSATLQFSVLIVALCGIVYELIIATIASYLLGNSVYQFSITIGLFMFAMGLGSFLTRLVNIELIKRFVLIELAVAIVGGLSSVILFLVYPWTIFYKPVMYLLIVLIGGMVGLEIPLLTRLLSDAGGVKKSIAHVLALDYFGALIGSVTFPILLLPYLGLFRASFSIGLLNAIIALVNIYVFAEVLKQKRMWLSLAGLTVLVLCVGMFGASYVLRFAEGQLYSDQIVFIEQTPYQRIVLTKHELSGKHRLYLDGHLQFAEGDEYRYHESLVHPIMSLSGNKANILVLGGGDGMVIREVLKYKKVKRIDLVDIDPAMVDLCRRNGPIKRINKGALEDDKLIVHFQDAFTFLQKSNRSYDRIIVDLPDPHNEVLSKLYSIEFYRLLRSRLDNDGYFVTQSSSPWQTRKAYWAIGDTIKQAGMNIYSYHVTVPSFNVWGFHLGAKHGDVPSVFSIEKKTRFLTDEVMHRASAFGKDESYVHAGVNSIFEPILYLLYMQELNP